MRLELKKRRKRRDDIVRRVFAFVLMIIPISIACAIYFIGMKATPLFHEVAQSELESIAYDIIVNVAEEELSRNDISYDGLVNIERMTDGRVSSITTDMQKVNLLKLRIAGRLSEEMLIRTEDVIKVPLGNLSGMDFLTGAGPSIPFRIMWVSSVDSDFSNSFEAVGINQTRHRIMLDFTINVGMMFAGREIGTDVTSSVCVAETIIVGDIPKYFFEK